MGPECSLIRHQLALDVHSQLNGRLGAWSSLSHVPYGFRLPRRSKFVPCLARAGDVPAPHAEASTHSINSHFSINACQAVCRTASDDCTTRSVIGRVENPVESAGYEAQLESFAALEYVF